MNAIETTQAPRDLGALQAEATSLRERLERAALALAELRSECRELGLEQEAQHEAERAEDDEHSDHPDENTGLDHRTELARAHVGDSCDFGHGETVGNSPVLGQVAAAGLEK